MDSFFSATLKFKKWYILKTYIYIKIIKYNLLNQSNIYNFFEKLKRKRNNNKIILIVYK